MKKVRITSKTGEVSEFTIVVRDKDVSFLPNGEIDYVITPPISGIGKFTAEKFEFKIEDLDIVDLVREEYQYYMLKHDEAPRFIVCDFNTRKKMLAHESGRYTMFDQKLGEFTFYGMQIAIVSSDNYTLEIVG